MAAFAIFLSTYLWSLVVSQDEPCVAEQCCFNGGSKDVATMVQLHVVQSGNASAQRDPCPQGFSDFSYNFTGLGGQFPSGVAFTTPPNVEIAPNLELVSFSSTTDSNPAIWKSLSPSWKSLVLQGSCTTVNDPFIQLGDWRLATYDFDTLSITHRDGKTATYYKSGGSYHDGPHNTFNGYHCAGPPSGKLKAGDHFLQLGSWRIGASDDQHLSISHSQGQTAMIFRGFDATLHPGPRTDHNLWSKPTLTTPIGVTFGDGFAQIGKFRLGEFDSTHFSVSHEGGKTVQMFKDDGNTVHGPGPAEGFNFSTFGRPEYQDLQTCSNSRETEYCHILGVLKISPSGGEIDCDPGLGNSARIGLRFTESIRLISLNFWGVQSSDDLTVTLGSSSQDAVAGGPNAGSEQIFNTQVTDWSLTFKGPAGVNGIRYCRPDSPASSEDPQGGVMGDPHITTLDGKHYLLLNQGSFSLWRFSGSQTEFHSQGNVDWQIYTHYSGHQSFTKGLLLVDQSAGHFRRALEMTSQDCVWRTRTDGNDWEVLKEPQLLSAAVGTGFNITSHNHVRLYMNTKDGHREVAVLSFSCRPRHNLDLAIQMRHPEDVKFVQGELRATRKAPETSMLQMTDDEFEQQESWKALGGSEAASLYLEAMDEPAGSNFARKCGEAQKADAAKICAKHLGENMQSETSNGDLFGDCVFDVCHGAGEVAAELAAELIAVTKDVV